MIESFYTRNEINPIWQAFRSAGYPEDGQSGFPPLASLPAFLRTLLITDGTVTRSLEAFFWEPITIEQLSLKTVVTQQNIPWLQCKLGEQVLIREVQLKGNFSQKIYTTAYSIILLERIPHTIRNQLVQGGIGIGVLISQFKVESYREILDIGFTQSLSFNNETANAEIESDTLYRTYRIMVEKEPTILITEKFPKNIYQ